MNPNSSLFFLLPLTLCLIFHPVASNSAEIADSPADSPTHSPAKSPTASPSGAPVTKTVLTLITKACSGSTHKDFCEEVFKSRPISEDATLRDLAFLGVRIAATNATDTSAHVKQYRDSKGLTPALQQALADCSDYYLDAADQLEDSLAAFSVNEYKDVNTWVNVAIGDIDACEIAVKAQSGPIPKEVSSRNQVARRLINNALSVVHVYIKH